MTKELVRCWNTGTNDETLPVVTGSATVLQRAMTVTNLNDMLDCIKDMKLHASTIEQDLPEFFKMSSSHRFNDTNIIDFETDDFIQLAKQHFHKSRYILLNDFIEKTKKPTKSSSKVTTKNDRKTSLIDKQVEHMKRIISAQPSALEAIYLEALLNPDQWKQDHYDVTQQTSPTDNLTSNERKRLHEILK